MAYSWLVVCNQYPAVNQLYFYFNYLKKKILSYTI